jgi:hypothetical protein
MIRRRLRALRQKWLDGVERSDIVRRIITASVGTDTLCDRPRCRQSSGHLAKEVLAVEPLNELMDQFARKGNLVEPSARPEHEFPLRGYR